MAEHIMVDIETFGKSNKTVIPWLGAVKFDADTVIGRFSVGIDPADCQRYGLEMDADTVMWWMHPDRDEARKQLVDTPKVDLHSALSGFALWAQETAPDKRGDLWGNGATFDNVKLKAAFDAAHIKYPFSYKQDACYRTMKNRCPDIEFLRVGTFHNPVDDAFSQAVHLQKICRHMGVDL